MTNALKGVLLGVVNALLIAMLVTAYLSSGRGHLLGHWMDGFGSVTTLSLLAAAPIGAAIGVFAGMLRDNRLIVLVLIALTAIPIAGLAIFMVIAIRTPPEFPIFVLIAASPTTLAVICLERWTRRVVDVSRALGLGRQRTSDDLITE